MSETSMPEKPKVADLDANIAAYEEARDVMEEHHLRKFVVFHNRKFIGAFDTFDTAAQEAVRRFGRGPYLIREVGAGKLALPSSVMFQPVREHAAS